MKHAVLVATALMLPNLLTAQTAPNACQLLPTVEVERVTGEKSEFAPVPAEVGAACLWSNVKLYVYGDTADQRIAAATKEFGLQKAKPVPVAGLGEKAMAFAPQPAKGEDKLVYVLAKQGRYLVNVSVVVPAGKTADVAQGQAVELAKLVVAKLQQ